MTLFICDGTNILMDKVTTHYHDFNRDLHPEFHYKGGDETTYTYHDRDSKINGIIEPCKIKLWGDDIVVWSFVGRHEDQFNIFLTEDNDLDIQCIVTCANTFGSTDILGKETTYLFLTKANVSVLYWDTEVKKYRCFDYHLSKLQKKNEPCFIRGLGSDQLAVVQGMVKNRALTAIENMVIAQAQSSTLGRKFDHYHIPTGKLYKDIDLSDRQRKLIIDKVKLELDLSHIPKVDIKE